MIIRNSALRPSHLCFPELQQLVHSTTPFLGSRLRQISFCRFIPRKVQITLPVVGAFGMDAFDAGFIERCRSVQAQ